MTWNGLPLRQDDNLWDDIDSAGLVSGIHQQSASPQLAATAGDMAAAYPDADPGVMLSLSQAVTDGSMSAAAANRVMEDSLRLTAGDAEAHPKPEPEPGRPWWSRAWSDVFSGVKTVGRTATAALMTFGQLATNAAAAVYGRAPGRGIEDYQEPTTGFFDGWFASTDLGAIMSGADPGDGWFVGEAAREYQTKKAVAYRGGFIHPDGSVHAFTFGRTVGGMFWDPGTGGYNVLSGLVDAAVALKLPAVPTKWAGAAARAGVLGEGVEGAARSFDEATDLWKARRWAGLTDGQRPVIIADRVDGFLDSPTGAALVTHLTGMTNIEDVASTFRGKLPIGVLDDIAKADTPEAMKQVLRTHMGMPVGSTGIMSVNQMPRLSAHRRWQLRYGTPSWPTAAERSKMGTELRRLKARAMGDKPWVMKFDSEVEATESLRGLTHTMDTLRVKSFETVVDGESVMMTREELVERFVQFAKNPEAGTRREVNRLIDDMLVESVVTSPAIRHGVASPRAAASAVAAAKQPSEGALRKAAKAILGRSRHNDDSLFGDVAGMVDETVDNGQTFADPEVLRGLFDDAHVNRLSTDPMHYQAVSHGDGSVVSVTRVNYTADISSEMARLQITMPNMRNLRRATSKVAFLWEKGSIIGRTSLGDPNALTSMLDGLQTMVWRTLVMMTGGYVTRNILESMFRQALTKGLNTGPRHPIQWLQAMTNRTAMGGLNGVWWDDLNAAGHLSEADKIAADAIGMAVDDLNPVRRTLVGQRRNVYATQERGAALGRIDSNDYLRYRQGIADTIQLHTLDELSQRLARGENYDQIVEWLRGTEGGEYLQRMNQMWRGIDDPAGSGRKLWIQFVDDDGAIIEHNLQRYLGDLKQRLHRDTLGGNPALMRAIGGTTVGTVTVHGRPITVDQPYGRLKIARPHPKQPGVMVEHDIFLKDKVGDGFFTPAGYAGHSDEFLAAIDDIIKDTIGRVGPEVLPQRVKYRVHPFGPDDAWGRERVGMYDRIVDRFFGHVFASKDIRVNRSPVFRQFYYQIVDELAPHLDAEDAQQIIRNVAAAAGRQRRHHLEVLKSAKSRMGAQAELEYWVPTGWFGEKFHIGEWVDETEWTRRLGDAATQLQNHTEGVAGLEITDLLDDLSAGGGRTWGEMSNKFGQDYVGDSRRWETLVRRATDDTAPAERVTAAELDLAAKAYAADETKRLFYNASERSNFADISRIVAPFGPAWREMMVRYMQESLQSPQRLKNASVALHGVTTADPEGDGRGLLFRDPVSGELMFNYPFDPVLGPLISGFGGMVLGQALGTKGPGVAVLAAAGAAAQQITSHTPGLDAELVAPVRSLSMGFSYLPGFGPVVQMVAREILGGKPKYRDILDAISPMGAEEITPEGVATSLIPAWAKRVSSAIQADPRTDSRFADLYMDATRALAASGEYDLTNPEDVHALEQRAQEYARKISIFQAIGQFVGPARPTPVFDVPVHLNEQLADDDVKALVSDGHVYSNFLGAAFRQFQDEDFSTATVRFIDTFGKDTLLYVAPSTRTEVEGLGVSRAVGDFEGNHPGFVGRHPEVYGYFTPSANDFDYQTYIRQFREGKRVRTVDPQQLIADAEASVGKSLFRAFRRGQGMSQTVYDRTVAAEYKKYLYATYPGYQTAEMDINKQPAIISWLQTAASDREVASNEIGIAARLYFQERDRAVEEANRRRLDSGNPLATSNELSGAANSDLRMGLMLYGERLSARYPQFHRLWSRVLFNEVESV